MYLFWYDYDITTNKMISILLWWISAALDSMSLSFRKKALDNCTLSKTMFKYFAFIFGFFIVIFLYKWFWIQFEIFYDIKYLLLTILIVIVWTINTFIHLHILKNAKLSELLPYDNLDKLFVVIIWYFLYKWTGNETSLITLWITLLTIIVIVIFTIDFRKIRIPKSVGLYSLYKLIKAWLTLSISYILLSYTNITFVSLNWLIELVLYTLIALLLKDSFKSLFKQSKVFYTNRFLATLMWRTAYILWLYIIETSWVVIATLLWFLSIVFNIFAMKFILKDTPERKQIILAIIVITFIWIWYLLN